MEANDLANQTDGHMDSSSNSTEESDVEASDFASQTDGQIDSSSNSSEESDAEARDLADQTDGEMESSRSSSRESDANQNPVKRRIIESYLGLEDLKGKVAHLFTDEQIALELQSKFPGVLGLSARSVKRMHHDFGVHSVIKGIPEGDIDEIVSPSRKRIRTCQWCFDDKGLFEIKGNNVFPQENLCKSD